LPKALLTTPAIAAPAPDTRKEKAKDGETLTDAGTSVEEPKAKKIVPEVIVLPEVICKSFTIHINFLCLLLNF
jgi:hypothetical protein